MELESPELAFPSTFCCNCGDTNCLNEIQDTRVTRYFGIGGTETTFRLPVPICAACRKTTRRRPSGFFAKLLVFALTVAVVFLALLALGESVQLPLWFSEHVFWISAALGLVATLVFYHLRRAKAPKTSFYQPVRIRQVSVQVSDLMSGRANVVFMKLAFTNPDYLNIFINANRDMIKGGRIAVSQA